MSYIKLIKKNIQPNQMIDNWSVAGRIKIRQYKFIGVGNSDSECYLQNPNNEKVFTATESDFQFLAEKWNDYKNGNILRHELRDLNRSTTYTICIMHYLEENHLI